MNESERQLGIIDLATGNVVREFNENVMIVTKKQHDFYQTKLQQSEAQKDYGPFTWMLYNCGEKMLGNFELTASTITRLIYMSTFLGYEGYLVHDNYKTLKKDALKKKIGVSDREFNSFWKEITVDNNIIYEDNQRIFVNKSLFIKGEISKKILKNNDVVRLAVNGVRALYENVDTVRAHKNLSILFRILPFVNKEWNIVCKNPKENEREFIDYMTVTEFCKAVGYNVANARKLVHSLSTITFNGESALIYMTLDFSMNKSKIVINPNLYWAGTNWNNVKYLSYWFKS